MRHAFLAPPRFRWDGKSYTLTSAGLAGATPAELAAAQRASKPAAAQRLVDAGVMLPVNMGSDCALDGCGLVVGALTPEEEGEWLARFRSRLSLPCGRFLLVGGGGEPENYADPHYAETRVEVAVPPGDYDVQVLLYLGSALAPRALGEDAEALAAWFTESRPGAPRPAWLEALQEDEDAWPQDEDLVGALVHLAPAAGPAHPARVDGKPYGSQVRTPELRRPPRFPLGLSREAFAAGAVRLG
jgi:hypothetical protein